MAVHVPVWYLSAVLVAGWGAVTDLRHHKIYNKLTISAMIAGILFHVCFYGIRGCQSSLLGILPGMACILFWLSGMLKAGDIKLYMAVGALAGWGFCGYTLVSTVLSGGVLAAVLMVVRKNGRVAGRRLWIYLMNLIYTRQFHRYRPEEPKSYFSFGCCIFAGTLVALWKLY